MLNSLPKLLAFIGLFTCVSLTSQAQTLNERLHVQAGISPSEWQLGVEWKLRQASPKPFVSSVGFTFGKIFMWDDEPVEYGHLITRFVNRYGVSFRPNVNLQLNDRLTLSFQLPLELAESKLYVNDEGFLSGRNDSRYSEFWERYTRIGIRQEVAWAPFRNWKRFQVFGGLTMGTSFIERHYQKETYWSLRDEPEAQSDRKESRSAFWMRLHSGLRFYIIRKAPSTEMPPAYPVRQE